MRFSEITLPPATNRILTKHGLRVKFLDWTPVSLLFQVVTRAETEAEATLVRTWSEAAKIDWRAARDMLARRFPERWAQSRHPDVQGGTGFSIHIHLEED